MKNITKKDCRIFKDELAAFFNEELKADVSPHLYGEPAGRDLVDVWEEFPTAYGPLLVCWFSSSYSVYNIAARFTGSPPPTAHIFGVDTGGTNNKMFMSLSSEWGPLEAARQFITSLRSVGIGPIEVVSHEGNKTL